MNLEALAKAVEEEQVRTRLAEEMTLAEASAFAGFVGEYERNEILDKIDKNV